jgi:hypothetical protein
MKKKTITFLLAFLGAALLLTAVFTFNQLTTAANQLTTLHPYAGTAFLTLAAASFLTLFLSAYQLFRMPRRPSLPENDSSGAMEKYARHFAERMPAHPMHPETNAKQKDLRWVKTNLKFLEVDALAATKEIATKNFFVGAFAQNTSYGTTTSTLNMLKLTWRIYGMHHRNQNLREFSSVILGVYRLMPLSDFRKEEIPTHIKPIIQSAFSNTLSSLLPAGNLLAPLFLNLFMAGATNAYLTCLAGIITARRCQIMSEEDHREIVQQSTFEAAFMLKEIVHECNPILSLTISNSVKKAGIESLDTVSTPSAGSGIAQDIVSHLASSIKHIMRENS